MKEDRIGVCLMSCVRHQGTYAPILAAHPRLQITCVADEVGAPEWIHDVNRTFAERYQVPYRSAEEALARADVDLVCICSEPGRHARLAVRALDSGASVLLDKPMAVTPREAEALRKATETSSAKFTFVHHLFNENVEKARKLIDSGRLAVPWAFHIDIIAGGGLDPAAVEDFEMVVNPELSGGGELMNWLNYAVGTLRYLSGLEVESVYALADTFFFEPHGRYGVEDFGVVALNLQRGATATVTAGRIPAKIDGIPGSFTVRGQGLYGMFVMDLFRPRITIERPRDEPAAGLSPMPSAHGTEKLIDDLVRCIDEDRSPRAGVEDGVAIARVVDAVYRSVGSGRREIP